MPLSISHFNRVVVLDSLPRDEWQTGHELFNDKLRWIGERHKDLDAEYKRVKDAAELLANLKDLARGVREQDIGPILHIEAHGDKNGLKLSSGEHVAWQMLKEALVEINHACRNNLLLTLAVCEGGHIIDLLTSSVIERAPFWGMIGSDGNILNSDAAGFGEFYDVLLHTFDGTAALARLNAWKGSAGRTYSFVHCEQVLLTIFRRYLEVECAPNAIEDRILRIELRARFNFGPKTVQLAGRKLMRKLLKPENQEKYFQRYRRRFLMIDEFPENEHRFLISFQDCLKTVV